MSNKQQSLFTGLFSLRGELTSAQQRILAVLGFLGIVGAWSFIVKTGLASEHTLPLPWDVLAAFKELHFEDALVRNLLFSVKLNLSGLVIAAALAIPIGFLIGLIPLFRGLVGWMIESIRYLPLAAMTGVFIMWFGIYQEMKIAFLAFSVFVYLVPTVIGRINEVDRVHVDTMRTIGATDLQIVRRVFIPDVLARVWGDIINLTAISWTYIIIAELLNSGEGGVGHLIWLAKRQIRIDKMFAILAIITLWGVLQDRILRGVGHVLFGWYSKMKKGGSA